MASAVERVLVTGGQGFLGAWVLKLLLEQGAEVTLFDLRQQEHILRQILTEEELSKVSKVYGDIADFSLLKDLVLKMKPTSVIHLAGLQIPLVRANPQAGAAVNVTGTINVFEACKALAEETKSNPIPVVYASSGAVLGPSSDYPSDAPIDAETHYHKPRTLYGVMKLCNEGTARIYWDDHKLPSVGLRPLTIFGVGREVGLTSGPTKAIKAAVLGRPFECQVTGVTGFHYVVDCARFFVDSAQALLSKGGAHVCGIKGHLVSYEAFLAEAAKAMPAVATLARIAPGAPEVPIHGDVNEAPLQALLGRAELHKPLAAAVAEMVKDFEALKARGLLSDSDLGPPPAKL